MKVKIIAVEMTVLLVVSGSVGYLFLSRPGVSSGRDDDRTLVTQEIIKPTADIPSSVEATIDAGPVLGYAPLTVYFHGNPANDARIVSYHWEFGPRALPVIPQSNYRTMRIPFLLFFIFPILTILIYLYRIRINSQYESTDRDPTMVFVSPGSYSATLTVTDAQGVTSTDTIWITVLQRVSEQNFPRLTMKRK
jgi:PKD repeat protein